MGIKIKESKFGKNTAELVLDNENLVFVCNDDVIEEYGSGVWRNIKDEGWLIDVFFDFAIQRYISSKPSEEYLYALAEINGKQEGR